MEVKPLLFPVQKIEVQLRRIGLSTLRVISKYPLNPVRIHYGLVSIVASIQKMMMNVIK